MPCVLIDRVLPWRPSRHRRNAKANSSPVPRSGGTWSFVVDLPDVNGKRRQLRRRGFPSKKAAQTQLTALLADKNRGALVAPSKATLGSFLLDVWLPHL